MNYLITGASSGIGEACAKQLANTDTTLLLTARNRQKLNKMAETLPGKVYGYVCDFNRTEEIKGIFDFCKEHSIKLDGLVHCAGMDAAAPVKVVSQNMMETAMKVNFFSFVELAKLFYSKRYSNDCASIVAISSIASLLCEKGMLPYTASKAALNAAVRTMAKEFIGRKIRVNAILPGGVNTPMTVEKVNKMYGSEAFNNDVEIPEQSLGLISAENIAKQVSFFLSEDSCYTTGELFTVSGGRSF